MTSPAIGAAAATSAGAQTTPLLRPMVRQDVEFALFTALLERGGQPTHDLNEPGQRFFMLEGGKAFGGFAAYGEHVLLRSIVVRPEHRGAGAGALVVAGLLDHASRGGARWAWLLTFSAAPFFRKLGFEDVPRAEAPASIAATRQFAIICPVEIAFQRKRLAG